MSDPEHLYHCAAAADWAARSESHYQPASYADEGFVHLSAAPQIVDTLHRYYLGREDLLLLTVDPSHLVAELVWEDLYSRGMAFPHVYGPIDLVAVVAATPLTPDGDGRFDALRATLGVD